MTHADLLRTLRTLAEIEDDVPYGVTKAAAYSAFVEIGLLRSTLTLIAELAEGSKLLGRDPLPSIARLARNDLDRLSPEKDSWLARAK